MFHSLNPFTDFHQIFRGCLTQEDLKLIRFWWHPVTTVAMGTLLRFSGLKVCGCSTALTPAWIFTKFSGYVYPKRIYSFLCQLTCQSAGIMSSLCGVGVRVRVNNFSSKTTRPRDVLFFLKDTLSIEDEKLFKACKSVCSSVC